MANIEIYVTQPCPYCVRVKKLFAQKNVTYKEIDVSNDAELRKYMTDIAGGRTSVPQIFIDDQHIGGCDDTYALDKEGKLDALLAK